MQRRNPKTKEYEAYSPPEGWHYTIALKKLYSILYCKRCGEELEYWKCYTSTLIGTPIRPWYGTYEEREAHRADITRSLATNEEIENRQTVTPLAGKVFILTCVIVCSTIWIIFT